MAARTLKTDDGAAIAKHAFVELERVFDRLLDLAVHARIKHPDSEPATLARDLKAAREAGAKVLFQFASALGEGIIHDTANTAAALSSALAKLNGG